MSNSFYNNSKAILHTYSHSPYIEGQQFTDQATARSGHYINQYEVRSEKIPQILSIEERDQYYLIDNGGVRVVGGTLGKDYTNIIKFIDKLSLRVIPNTNDEAWVVVDENGNVIKNFICPTDAQVSETKPSNGYDIQLYSADGETKIPFNYGWSFDTFNGIMHFDSKFNPNSVEWINLGFGVPRIEAFIYIGKYASDEIESLDSEIQESLDYSKSIDNSSIAIQPFKFSTDEMERIDDPYIKEYTGILHTVPEYYQRLKFIVKGYCFEISSVDNSGKAETFITEMSHITDTHSINYGDTEIYIDVPWNVDYNKPIIYYEFDSGIPDVGNRTPVIGRYIFIAASFIRNDGNKIRVKEIIDYASPSGSVEPSANANYDRAWPVPHGCNCGCNDQDNNININLNF